MRSVRSAAACSTPTRFSEVSAFLTSAGVRSLRPIHAALSLAPLRFPIASSTSAASTAVVARVASMSLSLLLAPTLRIRRCTTGLLSVSCTITRYRRVKALSAMIPPSLVSICSCSTVAAAHDVTMTATISGGPSTQYELGNYAHNEESVNAEGGRPEPPSF